MINYLKQTSPWLRFVGVLGFIFCGLFVFGGIIFTIIFMAIPDLAEDAGGIAAFFGLLYALFGVLYFFPSRFIYNFGSKIRNYLFSNSEEDLELALKNNKSLWKFIGIICIISIAVIPLSIVIAIVGGIAAVSGIIS
jgi:membrane protease YdiL (CAAX protease family)